MDIRFQGDDPPGSGQWIINDATGALAAGSNAAEWHHVAYVIANSGHPSDGGAYAITYVDGVQVGGISNPGTGWDGYNIGNQDAQLIIGAERENNGGRDFTGLVDDIALFAGVVSEEDIAAIAGGTLSPAAFIPEPSSLALLGLGGLLVARRRRG